MKSKNEFASLADYREYLIAYYSGQILVYHGANIVSGEMRKVNEQTIYDAACVMASVVCPPAFEDDAETA